MNATDSRRDSLLRAPRSDVDPDLVLNVMNQIRDGIKDPALVIEIGDGPDPRISIVEGERVTAVTLSELTAMLGRFAVGSTPACVKDALNDWLDVRPVSDQTAEERGIVTIGWSRNRSRIRWRVVVPRPSGTFAEWIPTTKTTTVAIRRVQTKAFARSRQLTVTPLPTGEVTVWAYLLNPALSTAVLTAPESLAGNTPLDQLWAVFSPGRPVAVADKVAATRLTEESNEPHMMIALADLNNIGWV